MLVAGSKIQDLDIIPYHILYCEYGSILAPRCHVWEDHQKRLYFDDIVRKRKHIPSGEVLWFWHICNEKQPPLDKIHLNVIFRYIYRYIVT